jgi:hypothetical protein
MHAQRARKPCLTHSGGITAQIADGLRTAISKADFSQQNRDGAVRSRGAQVRCVKLAHVG